MSYNYCGIFAEIYNNKKDRRLNMWLRKADILLTLKSCKKLAPHITSEDVILDIITGVLTGRINWDMKRVPNVTTFMFHQIRSYVSNLHRKELNRAAIYSSYSDCLPLPERKEVEDLPGLSFQDLMKEQEFVELKDIICSYLENDVIAYFIFEELLSGAKNSQAAENLKITLREVKNGRRRLRKILKRILKMLEN